MNTTFTIKIEPEERTSTICAKIVECVGEIVAEMLIDNLFEVKDATFVTEEFISDDIKPHFQALVTSIFYRKMAESGYTLLTKSLNDFE